MSQVSTKGWGAEELTRMLIPLDVGQLVPYGVGDGGSNGVEGSVETAVPNGKRETPELESARDPGEGRDRDQG